MVLLDPVVVVDVSQQQSRCLNQVKDSDDDDLNEEEDADIEEFIKNDDDDADSIDNLNV